MSVIRSTPSTRNSGRVRPEKKRSLAASRNQRSLPQPPPAIRWEGGIDGYLSLLDQTQLPGRALRLRIRDVKTLWSAIRRLVVRGAPAIGVAAAYGVVVGAQEARRRGARGARPSRSASRDFRRRMDEVVAYLATARPTAVNLFWALDRMRSRLGMLVEETVSRAPKGGAFDVDAVLRGLLDEARSIHQEDEELCRAIGRHGARLLRSGWTILTHCNAGALATGGGGTALSVVYEAVRGGKRIAVYADETRPLLQGARLTAWELRQAGIDVTLICDNAAASVCRSGRVQAVVVGADRIASTGDVANKIGTYAVAILAHEHGIPFYVAAPSTTFDLSLKSGREIPIEERSGEEVAEGFGTRTAPKGISVYNPAFDVTPARYVTAIITEAGVIRPPYTKNIRSMLRPSRKS